MTSYTARVELDHPALRAAASPFVSTLDGFHPVASRSDTGRLQITVTYQAESFRTAVQIGLGVMLANGWTPTAIEVMPTDTFDQRVARPPIPELLSVSEAAELLGVTQQEIEVRIQNGTLPAREVGSSHAVARAAVPDPTHPETPMQAAQRRMGLVHAELTGNIADR